LFWVANWVAFFAILVRDFILLNKKLTTNLANQKDGVVIFIFVYKNGQPNLR